MNTYITLTDKFEIWNGGEIKKEFTVRTAPIQDVKLSPCGTQLVCVPEKAELHGISFVSIRPDFSLKFFDLHIKNKRVTCCTWSNKYNYIIYFGTADGHLIEFNLKTKRKELLYKCSKGQSISSLSVNCTDCYLAAIAGARVVIFSFKNKVGSEFTYAKANDIKIVMAFHPSRQFELAVHSGCRGASLVDISKDVNTCIRSTFRHDVSDHGHCGDASSLLWYTSDVFITTGFDGRIYQYNLKRQIAGLFECVKGTISCCTFAKDGELLLGMKAQVALFNCKTKSIRWSGALKSNDEVRFLILLQKVLSKSTFIAIDHIYTQDEPELEQQEPVSKVADSCVTLISPLKSQPDHKPFSFAGQDFARKSIGKSLISPLRNNGVHSVNVTEQSSTLTVPSQLKSFSFSRSTPNASGDENLASDSLRDFKIRRQTSSTLQSIDESSVKGSSFGSLVSPTMGLTAIDIGMDCTSPIKSKRSPFSDIQQTSMVSQDGQQRNINCIRGASTPVSRPRSSSQTPHSNEKLDEVLQQNAQILEYLKLVNRQNESILKELKEVKESVNDSDQMRNIQFNHAMGVMKSCVENISNIVKRREM